MQGFYFCPATYQPRTSACNGLSAIHAINYTATMQKAFTGLYRCVSGNLTHFTAYNTRPAKADITPPAPRWSVSQRRSTSSAYQIPTPRRTLYRAGQQPYYNKVYKGAPLLWIHARRCSISQTMPAAASQYIRLVSCAGVSPAAGGLAPGQQSGRTLHPAGQSSGRGAAGERNHWQLAAASLFGLSPDNQ